MDRVAICTACGVTVNDDTSIDRGFHKRESAEGLQDCGPLMATPTRYEYMIVGWWQAGPQQGPFSMGLEFPFPIDSVAKWMAVERKISQDIDARDAQGLAILGVKQVTVTHCHLLRAE